MSDADIFIIFFICCLLSFFLQGACLNVTAVRKVPSALMLGRIVLECRERNSLSV